MTPLNQIGLRWRDHPSALWWVGVLYRHPSRFDGQLMGTPKWQTMLRMGVLYLHLLPWIVIVGIMGRILLFGVLGKELQDQSLIEWLIFMLLQSILLIKGIIVGNISGIIGGIIFGAIEWIISRAIYKGIFWIIFGLLYGLIFGSFSGLFLQ